MQTTDEMKDHSASSIADLAALLETASDLAATDRPVLFVARRGSGPLLLAEAMHRASLRPREKFAAVRCGLCPPATVDLRLFGPSGSRAGSRRRPLGAILAADEGTLFVEQVQNASPEAQSALLRMLDDKEVTIDGVTHRVDVRVMASAPPSLEADVARGRFRPDLFYRLNAMPLSVPASCMAREAILGVRSGIREVRTASGSVGRLECAVRNAMAGTGAGGSPEEFLARTLGELRPRLEEDAARRQLEAAVSRAASQVVANHASLGPGIYDMLLIEMQRALIRRAFKECNGMLTRAAGILGLSLQELETRIGALGLTLSCG